VKLRKADVEVMLATYDTDPVGALTVALRLALDRDGATWEDLLGALNDPRRAALLAREPAALDQLAAELNELRTVPQRFT
jgi:hypothetical protein